MITRGKKMKVNKPLISHLSLILILTGLLLFSGCGRGGHRSQGAVNEYSAFQYDTLDGLTGYIKEMYATEVYPRIPQAGSAGSSGSDSGGANTNGEGSESAVSDLVKTDGRYFFIAGSKNVIVAEVIPKEDMRIIGQIPVRGDVLSLHLQDSRLITLYRPDGSRENDWYGNCHMLGYFEWIENSKTGILITDVRDPYFPLFIKNVEVDGCLVSSLVVEEKLHVVQQFRADLPSTDHVYRYPNETIMDVINANHVKLAPLGYEVLIPYLESFDDQGLVVERTPLVRTDRVMAITNNTKGGMLTVATIDLAEYSSPVRGLGLMTRIDDLYMSDNAIYLFRGDYEHYPPEYYLDPPDHYTHFYKLDIREGFVDYSAGGTVKGGVFNGGYCGEYDDVFYVLVRRSDLLPGGGYLEYTTSYLHCMKASEERLETIGAIEAPIIDAISVLFSDTRGYVGTFATDTALYNLDLSDPTNPAVVGTFNDLMYTRHHQFLDENHLLAFGWGCFDQNDHLYSHCLQLSLYNVMDSANPQRLYMEEIGDTGTTSSALFNSHQEFTFWPEYDLIAFPVNLYEHLTPPTDPRDKGTPTFWGIYVYRVTPESGFEYQGRISIGEAGELPAETWRRSVFHDENIYGVLNDEILAAKWSFIEGGIYSLALPE